MLTFASIFLPKNEVIKPGTGSPLTFGFAELKAPSIDRKYVIALKAKVVS
jgi:hypothetical protein